MGTIFTLLFVAADIAVAICLALSFVFAEKQYTLLCARCDKKMLQCVQARAVSKLGNKNRSNENQPNEIVRGHER